MRKRQHFNLYDWVLFILLGSLCWLGSAAAASPEPKASTPAPVSLAGEWRFQLDPDAAGRSQGWFDTELPDHIFLPGTTDMGGFGAPGSGIAKDTFGLTCLTRAHQYEGLAWYQKEVVVPTAWAGWSVDLFLERCHWQSEVWFDGKPVGTCDSLSAPHTYSLGTILPGRHRITVCIDNTYRMEIGRGANSISDDTQSNWNGIIGAIELRPHPERYIQDVQIYSGDDPHVLQAKVTVRSPHHEGRSGTLRTTVTRLSDHTLVASANKKLETADSEDQSIAVTLQGDFVPWSEWNPALYKMCVTLQSGGQLSEYKTTFGVRRLRVDQKHFLLNDTPLFLRGTLEFGAFPLTGHPPTDPAEWERILSIVQSYGLNHVRFNSWCPPEGAFAAADKLGVLFQVELPVSTKIDPKAHPEVVEFMRLEAGRIRQAYGNHPSFGFLSLGNQMDAEWSVLDDLTREIKALDTRQLVTFNSDHARMEPGPASDYFVGLSSKAGGPFRRHWVFDGTDGAEPSTDHEMSSQMDEFSVPTVFHEVGQWVVYPDYTEIGRYTGVLRPGVLEACREQAVANGIFDLVPDFHRASGAFAWAQTREEIESALRTGNMAGFQIFQLHDVPGAGEILVGALDVFRDSKEIFTPEQFRRFCSPTVPLLCMSKRVWTTEESFTATAKVSHYGPAPLSNASVEWRLRDGNGATLQSGTFPPVTLGYGLTTVGDLHVPLTSFTRPEQVNLELAVNGTKAANDWNIWVFPPRAEQEQRSNVTVCRNWADALAALHKGRRVVLALDASLKTPHTLPARFLPVAKSVRIFTQPSTMGAFCNPEHPALESFPTEQSADMQWWELLHAPSWCFDLSSAPAAIEPIVYAIDDFHFNRKLAYVFEAKMGRGKLLACSLDLLDPTRNGPVAGAFLNGLVDYAASGAFRPTVELSEEFTAAEPVPSK